MTGAALARIRVFAADAVSSGRLPAEATHLAAVGWGTVEFERAITELSDSLGLDADSFVEGAGSVALGARCLVVDGFVDGGIALAVIEPSAEGRLAAGLARWDEGPLVAWYEASATSAVGVAPRPGPFGPEWLVRGDPLTGPHRLLVAARTGTIPA